MPRSAPNPPESPAALPVPSLAWKVHLLRRDPRRLSGVAMVVFLGAACVWLMFGSLLPALAAVLLLLGAAGEYLFPIAYHITDEGVTVNSLTGRMVLRWQDVRRCWRDRECLILTPLPAPSRLDAFRGLTLRFAPDGEPGDYPSVQEAIARYAPALRSAAMLRTDPEQDGAGTP